MRVAYLTDIEGMWAKLETFAAGNPCVRLSGEQLIVEPDALFVFGGDAVDRGPHSQRIVRTLLEAKKRQPAQVVLLAGNRDLNKLRLRRELHGHPPLKMPREVRAKPPPEQLRWIFSNTMGAASAFEHRRTELGGATVSDDHVVQSFSDEVSDGGAHFEFLTRCQLGFRHGATLFVHGGVTEDNFLSVPGQSRAGSVDEWVESLNRWYARQLSAVGEDTLDAEGRPVWTQLMAYQAPLPGTRLNQTSVVYGRTADSHNNPLLPPAAVRERLGAEGLRRLVVGHTPNGDSPSVLRAPRFEQLIADNSHARVNDGAKVLLDDEKTSVDAMTTLDDGSRHKVAFELSLDDDDSPIGRRLKDSGELIKGRLQTGELLGFRYLADYVCVQRRIAENEARADRLVIPD